MKYNYFESIDVSLNIDSTIEKGIHKAINKKRNILVKKISIVSSLTLLIVLSSIFYNKDVIANVEEALSSIASYFQSDSNLNDYKTVINKSITDNGYTINLNEVVLDKNELIISYNIKATDSSFYGYPEASKNIYINGKKIMADSDSVSERINDTTENYIETYYLDENLSGKVNIKIEYVGINIIDDTGKETVEGSWVFDFKTDVDNLLNDTTTKEFYKKFEFENGQSIELKQYVSNSLEKTIEFKQAENGTEYVMKLMGTDNLGNPIEFYEGYSHGSNGIFKLDNAVGKIGKDTTKLNLSLYILPPESATDWEKYGESFVVNIK